jgi:hypothetical protein
MKGETVSKLASRAADLHAGDLERVRSELKGYASDLFREIEETPLPLLRAINHTIPLIDERNMYPFRLSRCPEPLRNLCVGNRYH